MQEFLSVWASQVFGAMFRYPWPTFFVFLLIAKALDRVADGDGHSDDDIAAMAGLRDDRRDRQA